MGLPAILSVQHQGALSGRSARAGLAAPGLVGVCSKLTRPLKDGFRMEGHLDQARLEQVYLPADGVTIAFRASGELKIIYGM